MEVSPRAMREVSPKGCAASQAEPAGRHFKTYQKCNDAVVLAVSTSNRSPRLEVRARCRSFHMAPHSLLLATPEKYELEAAISLTSHAICAGIEWQLPMNIFGIHLFSCEAALCGLTARFQSFSSSPHRLFSWNLGRNRT